MAILRNTASQGLYIYAHDAAADAAKTGDAANITAKLSKDGAAWADLTDTNPTEIGRGVYWFDLTQAETDAGALSVMAVSSTADVQIDPVLVLTAEAVPAVNVTHWKGAAAPDNTGDAFARLGAPAGASVSADVAALHNFDPATDTVKLNAVQGAVTFGQVKILANVAYEGALHVVNSNASGIGQRNEGGSSGIGQLNYSGFTGQHNYGILRGQHNYGISQGQYNEGSTYGQINYGSTSPVSGVDKFSIRAAVGLASANLDTQLSGIATNVSTVLARLGAWAGSGINNVLGALRAMMRADATTPSDIGGTFDPATDSLEALAAGGAINPQDVADAMALATAETPAAGSVLARLAAIQVVTDAIDASAVTTAPSNNAGHLTIIAALTYRMTASGLVIPANWTRAYWTLKTSTLLPDDAAIVQVLVSNPAAGSDGLLRINRAAPSGGLDNTGATLTINQAAGTATLWIDDDATRLLSDGSMTWDVKFIDANGHSTGARGTAVVITTETLTT